MNKQNPVYTIINECHDCYKCVRECPVKAIKIENGHASVLSEKCIACGNCVKACPSNAKRVRTDIDRVKNLLLAKKDVYVSLAPSWSGVFDYKPSKMISILKKLGIKEVSETALGAQQVSIKTAQVLNDSEKGLFISSACPVIVDYIRLYKPSFTKYIVPIASPALTHAKMLKDTYGDDISVVFIGPCVGKKNESDANKTLIDVALTFEELKFWINDENIKSSTNTEIINSFVPEVAFEGSLYPLDGGMNDTIKRIGVNDNVQLLNMCSLQSFENSLNGLNPENLEKVIFIEALSCDGGCVAGPCISTSKSGIDIMSNVLSSVKYRDKIPDLASVVVDLEYAPDEVENVDFPMEQILAAMRKIGKHSEDDELNCGGCGYSTCRGLAKALIKNEAEPSMCVSYMRKIAMRKAAAMLRCMPSATVMVDNDLRIIEANEAFMRMFCDDDMYEIFTARQDGLVGAAIDRIIDFSDIFKSALKSGKDIHKERVPIKNKLYDIIAFTIEKSEIVGAIITDVTLSETNREKIAQKAQEVISKNITIVQNIACLLGEHMVETEMLLSSIARDFDDKEEDK